MTGASAVDVSVPSVRLFRWDPTDRERWDAFVRACPGATFFHRSGWYRAVSEGLGHRCHYLIAERNGEIEGLLPLAEVRSRLFGHVLVSTPCCVYGGVAAISDLASAALIDAAVSLATRLRVDALELRHREAVCPGWPAKSLYVTFRKAISVDESENLKAIPRKQRAMVRKGIEGGLKGRMEDDIGAFYRIYSESVRNLGTPVFSRRYFHILLDEFHDDLEISVISDGRSDVATVLSFFFRDEVLPYYGGSLAAGRSIKANDFMYWDLMCRAAQRGARIFDYGRSKVNTGAYDFKRNWGFEPTPLHYEYRLVRAKRAPEVNPSNPKYRYFIAAWRHLPLGVANVVGPLLARSLG